MVAMSLRGRVKIDNYTHIWLNYITNIPMKRVGFTPIVASPFTVRSVNAYSTITKRAVMIRTHLASKPKEVCPFFLNLLSSQYENELELTF